MRRQTNKTISRHITVACITDRTESIINSFFQTVVGYSLFTTHLPSHGSPFTLILNAVTAWLAAKRTTERSSIALQRVWLTGTVCWAVSIIQSSQVSRHFSTVRVRLGPLNNLSTSGYTRDERECLFSIPFPPIPVGYSHSLPLTFSYCW